MQREHEPNEHAHHGPDKPTYNLVFVALTVLMLLSVGTAYIELPDILHYGILLTLMSVKVGLVVAYYMHLKYDNPLFTWVFILPVLMGLAVVLSLQGLAGY
ncbi:MAG: cytochrome C oxidase subunit IV family protein [Anaerolineae bacterium]|nr:cytochrome C oxidase subunit IV family protein [Anaerolineae bacterium]